MDRKEAKIRLQMLLVDRCSSCRFGHNKCTEHCEFEQAVDMAIEALSATNTEKLSSCGDLISREDAVKLLPNGLCYDSSGCVNALKNLPSADRPSGEWIYDAEAYPLGNPYGHYDCDQCGESVPNRTNYCPNCGAKMGSDTK